jgi:hypothetical protein
MAHSPARSRDKGVDRGRQPELAGQPILQVLLEAGERRAVRQAAFMPSWQPTGSGTSYRLVKGAHEVNNENAAQVVAGFVRN